MNLAYRIRGVVGAHIYLWEKYKEVFLDFNKHISNLKYDSTEIRNKNRISNWRERLAKYKKETIQCALALHSI